MKAKIFTIANHKGGVGKTTTTASLGAVLAMKGKKVLVIDLDAQQNLTYSLTGKEFDKSVYHSLIKGESLEPVNIRENLDIVPASLEMARAELDLSTKMAREGILKNLLTPLKNQYDYILIDCPPSLGIVTTNALVASDELLILLTAEVLPLKGLAMLDDVVEEVKRLVNPNLEIGGVIVTRYDKRRSLNREVIKQLEGRYGDKVFDTKIRENIVLAEMPMSGQTIFEYDPKSNGAKDYMELTEEFLTNFDTK